MNDLLFAPQGTDSTESKATRYAKDVVAQAAQEFPIKEFAEFAAAVKAEINQLGTLIKV